jgi:hypothetical protein
MQELIILYHIEKISELIPALTTNANIHQNEKLSYH